MMASTRTKTQAVIGILAYLVWALFAFIDPTVRPDFLKFHVATVIGVVGLILRDMPPKHHLPPPKDQP